MPVTKKNKKQVRKKTPVTLHGTIDPNMRSYANDPFFIKKAEQAKEILRQSPIPERTGKSKKR